MSIVAKLKKNELKLVVDEIGLTVPGDAKMVDLKRLIEESDVFKEDYEFVKTVIEQVLEEVKTQESQQNGEIELESLKLERVKAKLELAQLRTSANNSETSLIYNGGETEESIDVLIKSVRTLTIKVPNHRKILCVGGRLRHSNLPAEQKHPVLIPNNHPICDLIIKHYPVSYLHARTKATLANIRTKFWIVNGRSKVKRAIKQCIKCLKVSAKALTPAHFLIGSPLTSLPDPDFKEVPMNWLRRWELVQRMTQTFWSRWTSDYLNRLQSRPKWYKGNQKFKENVVLIKGEDNSKLLNWNLAKIVEVHPGTDDINRVVTLKTADCESGC
ncbi:integrase catalytic domain-containing protein [Trichonephila clavata]|uniref:Integrase catalytic domain-containing protein n=1 Tax=Trichonephila clavata TaxID=2740835 RepID=A0A8X6HYW1_TRICU|nr:integrase catalytic domain-containing protein [Trichonephila clavata]